MWKLWRCFLFVLFLVTSCFAEQQTKTTYMIEMRDGIRLAADVYLPRTGGPAFPVLFERTPYNKALGSFLTEYNTYGIAVVVQDVRGKFESEGVPRPQVDDGWGELQDGYDTIQWIRAQEWCNGRVAMHGASADGMQAVQVAGSAPPGLVGQYIVYAPISSYHATFYQGGVFRKMQAETWLGLNFPPEVLTLFRSHTVYDEFWRYQNLAERVEVVNWPVTLTAGWFDTFQQGTLDLFTEIKNNGGPIGRDHVHLIVGPWTHAASSGTIGELNFPDSARKPSQWPDASDWIRHWLVDREFPRGEPAPVMYYVMGEIPHLVGIPGCEWRTADTWPIPNTPTPFYLTADGGLQENIPESGRLSYTYDPNNPVPTVGGANLVLNAGPYDQRSVEDRDDVLVFNSEPLETPLEVTGHVTAILYVSCSTGETDFTAKLCDVYPDGRSMLLCDGIRRLNLRNSLSDPEPATPGEVYRVEIDMWSTSIVFNTGHRIRVSISSSNSPRFEPSTNTAEPAWASSVKLIAQQTVDMGGDHASYVQLPVIGKENALNDWNLHDIR